MVMKKVLEIVGGPLVHDEHRLAFALGLLLLIAQLTLLYLDIVLLGQPPQRLRVGHLLMSHQKAHGRTSLTARETLTDISGGRNIERRGALIVERT